MALPTSLIFEMRLAFRSCAQQHRNSRLRYFSNAAVRAKQDPPNSQQAWPYGGALSTRKQPSSTVRNEQEKSQTEEQIGLTTKDAEQRALDTGRKTAVPMKIIPKAQINPKMILTPRQRLHVEILTRRPPAPTEKKTFRERLQIYHIGVPKESMLVLLRLGSIMCASTVTFIIAPAHLYAGSAPWLVALIWLGGFVPGLATHYMTKNWISRIFVELPDKAREGAKAAMEYVKNLPSDAMLDMRHLKPWGLEGSIRATPQELVPTKGRWLRPASLTWSDRRSGRRTSSSWVPQEFFVEPKTISGPKSKNTVPGVWEPVYKQLTKEAIKEPGKWDPRLDIHKTASSVQ